MIQGDWMWWLRRRGPRRRGRVYDTIDMVIMNGVFGIRVWMGRYFLELEHWIPLCFWELGFDWMPLWLWSIWG
jgi:hypothetical protein